MRPDRPERTLLREAAERLRAAGTDSPLMEAGLLLAYAAGVRRLDVLAGTLEPPDADVRARFRAVVARRAERVPLAHLLGRQEFFGRAFEVTPATLVPRPETELLVEFGIHTVGDGAGALAIDVGTGGGCIAVSVAAEAPGARVLAVDLSLEALRVAIRNAERLSVGSRVACVRGDLLAPVASGSAAVVLSNPPYVATDDLAGLQPEVRDHEPRLALDGGPDGLSIHRRLARDARRALRPDGWLAVEVGFGQAAAVSALLRGEGYTHVAAQRDLAGIERMVRGRRGRA